MEKIKKIVINQITIVLKLPPNNIIPPKKGIQNLTAYDKNQKLIWNAELPFDYPHAYYNEVKYIDDKLYAWCGSMMYEIDLNDGKLLNSTFVK